MKDQKIAELEGQRRALLDQLRRLPNLMRGTVYLRGRKCGRRSCACAAGGSRHPGLQLTVNLGGKSRSRYVRQGEREKVEGMVKAYQGLWQLVNALTEVNLELLNARPIKPIKRRKG